MPSYLYENRPITRTIYRDSSIALSLFVSPVTVTDVGSKYTVDIKSVLFLQLNLDPAVMRNMSQEQWKSTRYPIRPSNLTNVRDFFTGIMGWFDPEASVFMQSMADDGLCINPEYKELELFTFRGYFDDHVMRARPAVIEVAKDKFEPGIYLNVNMKDNQVKLTKSQINRLCGIFKAFNFDNEIMLCIELLRHSIATGSMMSKEEFEQAKTDSGLYNHRKGGPIWK